MDMASDYMSFRTQSFMKPIDAVKNLCKT